MTGCSPCECKTPQLRHPVWKNWDRKHCFLPHQSPLDFSVDPTNSLTHLTSCPTHGRVTSTSTPLRKMPLFYTLAAAPLMAQEHVHPALTDKKKHSGNRKMHTAMKSQLKWLQPEKFWNKRRGS